MKGLFGTEASIRLYTDCSAIKYLSLQLKPIGFWMRQAPGALLLRHRCRSSELLLASPQVLEQIQSSFEVQTARAVPAATHQRRFRCKGTHSSIQTGRGREGAEFSSSTREHQHIQRASATFKSTFTSTSAQASNRDLKRNSALCKKRDFPTWDSASKKILDVQNIVFTTTRFPVNRRFNHL